MKHKMNLWNDSFEAIKDGWKTIEMRLNDEKRSKIEIGEYFFVYKYVNVRFFTIFIEKFPKCVIIKL